MWIDERGSEVLEPPECRRLLAVGAMAHLHGHVAVSEEEAPTVLPVDYSVHDSDVVLMVGEGLFRRLENRLVAFQVDGTSGSRGLRGPEEERLWSVLVRGLATELGESEVPERLPRPQVAEPGRRLVRIRTDVLTGRRLSSGP